MPYPTFHFILVVDIEGFGRRVVPVQQSLRRAMYEVVRTAFEDVHIDWDTVVRLDRGDGILLLVPTTANSVVLAGAFVRALDDALREKARIYTAEHQLRMRVALHQGNCQQDADGWVSEAINTASRLVDAPQLRAALAAATRSPMALIVSDEIYRSVVRHGFRQIEPASFGPVLIEAKELLERAWIQLPGHPYPPGIDATGPASQDPAAQPGPIGPGSGRSQSGGGGFVFHGNVTVEGDQVAGGKIVYGGEHR
ncbi:hypothetical protein CO540_04800 [Micromonospora sp. WMMA2032]|uniref:hypothetical protein n=1 Tax=Micromonospora sp. WMMA2032 TaxID=2039870 RepID=UPI000C05AC08|nr:hypothetical protein [Micromonospora sp. WMMA2032]ATO13229.1 hypothetical protein CO540_04800 [Micromonospora sp. WMMA2032]